MKVDRASLPTNRTLPRNLELPPDARWDDGGIVMANGVVVRNLGHGTAGLYSGLDDDRVITREEAEAVLIVLAKGSSR